MLIQIEIQGDEETVNSNNWEQCMQMFKGSIYQLLEQERLHLGVTLSSLEPLADQDHINMNNIGLHSQRNIVDRENYIEFPINTKCQVHEKT